MPEPRGPLWALDELVPRIAPSAFVAPNAVIVGDVRIGEESSVWFGCVLRGDDQPIRVGARSNIQDGSIVHVHSDNLPTWIGDDVTIGHAAIIHACTIEDEGFVGMGATVLDGAVIERGGMLAARCHADARQADRRRRAVEGCPGPARAGDGPRGAGGVRADRPALCGPRGALPDGAAPALSGRACKVAGRQPTLKSMPHGARRLAVRSGDVSVSLLRLSACAALVVVSLAGCSTIVLHDTAVMPRTAAGTPVMSDQGAIQTASYALGSPAVTAGRPVEAALALAAIDYLAGALYSNPHWDGIPATTKLRMLQARDEVRQVLAVAPGTPSQVVVDHLIRAANAFEQQDAQAALAALPATVFALGPQRTAALLANLPYLPQANIAAQAANFDISSDCAFNPNCG